jgi:hypothetical protein
MRPEKEVMASADPVLHAALTSSPQAQLDNGANVPLNDV